MRIGLFSGVYFPRKDGCCYTVSAWKQRLQQRGHDVHLIYPSHPGYEPEKNEIPVRSFPNPLHYGHRFPIPLGTRRLPEMDIVHCHSPGPLGLLGRYYAWRKNLPSVFSFHSPLEKYTGGILGSNLLERLLSSAYMRYDEAFLKSFDKVTSNTGEIQSRDLKPEKLPVGINTEFFRPREKSFVEELGLERPIALYSGRMSEEKNIEEILEMAERFSGTVLIVGEGRHRENLERMAPENTVFKDYVDREKLPELYSGADVFIQASTADTFSISSVEANSCGTPVVAPSVFPFTRVLKDESGETYQKGNIDDFLQKTSKAIENSYETRKASERYSMEKTIDRLEEIYREAKNGY